MNEAQLAEALEKALAAKRARLQRLKARQAPA
jgi:hypothetical protein